MMKYGAEPVAERVIPRQLRYYRDFLDDDNVSKVRVFQDLLYGLVVPCAHRNFYSTSATSW